MSPSGTYQKRRRSKSIAWRKVIVTALQASISLGLIGAFGYGFATWSMEQTRYPVRAIRVEGLRALGEDDVMTAAGISLGGNIFSVNEAEAQAAVEGLPYVKRCAVSSTFPDTVTVSIEERMPIASLMVNSHAYEIDEDGVVLREYGPLEIPKAPYLTNVSELGLLQPGARVEHEAVREALDVWKSFKQTAMAREIRVSELAAFKTDEIVMFADEIPCELRWGRGEYDLQAMRLNILWEELGKEFDFEEYVDLRFGVDLVCR